MTDLTLWVSTVSAVASTLALAQRWSFARHRCTCPPSQEREPSLPEIRAGQAKE